jgi:hypothetical protein
LIEWLLLLRLALPLLLLRGLPLTRVDLLRWQLLLAMVQQGGHARNDPPPLLRGSILALDLHLSLPLSLNLALLTVVRRARGAHSAAPRNPFERLFPRRWHWDAACPGGDASPPPPTEI